MRREDQPDRPQRDVTRPRSKPGHGWVCGYAEIGHCCQSGPTADGRCGRQACDSTAGNNCSEGSASTDNVEANSLTEVSLCIPRRSVAVRRSAMRLNFAVLTGGLLLLCMALPSREKTFVPGELSSKHAQILDNTLASQRCSLCHPTSHSSDDATVGNAITTGWLSSARRLVENDGRQDQLCMKCHQSHLPAAAARNPHDLPPEAWRKLQDTGDTPWKLVSTRSNTTDADRQFTSAETESKQSLAHTSCAMCHNEHQGRGFDVKLISDTRCQACHQRQFESLASGHPEFKNFPVDRPRGLAFSHSQHAQAHFPKKNRDFDCRTCHLSRDQGISGDAVTRSLSFEHACASCHDQPIRAATIDGWAVIQLPSIEANDISTDVSLADWPAGATYGYDGIISPVARALLMADPDAVEALSKLPGSGKIVDVSTISGSRAKVAKTLAAATRRLILETAQEGQPAWIARLQKVTRDHLGRELTEEDQALLSTMAAGLPPDLFRHIQLQWLGGPAPLASRDKAKGWRLTAARQPQLSNATKSGDDDLLVEEGARVAAEQANDLLLTGDDLLTTPSKSTDSSSETSDLLGPAPNEHKQSIAKLVKGSTHLTGGGWYADQSTLSIRYMPVGHADTVLAAWSLWWSKLESHHAVLPSSDAQLITQRLNTTTNASAIVQNQTLADTIPGKCTECHQMHNERGGHEQGSHRNDPRWKTVGFRLVNHYQVPERDSHVREFTKFQHTAHLTLPALNDCRYCHIEKKGTQPVGQSITIHHPSMSEFAAMKISQCVACHRPGGANDRCVQCHNYHVTPEQMSPPESIK